MRTATRRRRSALRALGLPVWEGTANFILTRPPRPAPAIVAACITQGIYLRDVGAHNLLRIAVKSPPDNARILTALRAAS